MNVYNLFLKFHSHIKNIWKIFFVGFARQLLSFNVFHIIEQGYYAYLLRVGWMLYMATSKCKPSPSYTLSPHHLFTYKFIITFASCFMMGRVHKCKRFEKKVSRLCYDHLMPLAVPSPQRFTLHTVFIYVLKNS